MNTKAQKARSGFEYQNARFEVRDSRFEIQYLNQPIKSWIKTWDHVHEAVLRLKYVSDLELS